MDMSDIAYTSPLNQIENRWNQIIKEIRSKQNLENGWGEGNELAPSKELIDWAEFYIKQTVKPHFQVPPPNYVSVTPDGSIVVEWYMKNNNYMSIEFSEPSVSKLMTESNVKFEHLTIPRQQERSSDIVETKSLRTIAA